MKGLAIVLATLLAQSIGTSAPELEGCIPPSVTAERVADMNSRPWSTLSLDKIRQIWPNISDETPCETWVGGRPDNFKSGTRVPCKIVVARDRTISGHCECCEAFTFQAKTDNAKETDWFLESLILHYSAANESGTIEAERLISKAAGVPQDQFAKHGREKWHQFLWTDSTGREFTMDVSLSNEKGHSELYVAWGTVPEH